MLWPGGLRTLGTPASPAATHNAHLCTPSLHRGRRSRGPRVRSFDPGALPPSPAFCTTHFLPRRPAEQNKNNNNEKREGDAQPGGGRERRKLLAGALSPPLPAARGPCSRPRTPSSCPAPDLAVDGDGVGGHDERLLAALGLVLLGLLLGQGRIERHLHHGAAGSARGGRRRGRGAGCGAELRATAAAASSAGLGGGDGGAEGPDSSATARALTAAAGPSRSLPAPGRGRSRLARPGGAGRGLNAGAWPGRGARGGV